MDDTTAALAAAIGARVRTERQARRWSLDRLAEAAGVSRRMLVNVEQGATNPSVGTLLRLSDALGIGLPALVDPPRTPAWRVTRASEAPVLWRSEAGGHAALVAGTQRPDVVELWDWTLAPGDRHESEPHTAGTQELLQVQAGTLVVGVDDRTVELGPGDALTFSGESAHSYANPGAEPARFTLAVFEPGVGA